MDCRAWCVLLSRSGAEANSSPAELLAEYDWKNDKGLDDAQRTFFASAQCPVPNA